MSTIYLFISHSEQIRRLRVEKHKSPLLGVTKSPNDLNYEGIIIVVLTNSHYTPAFKQCITCSFVTPQPAKKSSLSLSSVISTCARNTPQPPPPHLYVRNQVAIAMAPPATFCGMVWKKMMVDTSMTSLSTLITVIIKKIQRM